MNDLPLTGYRVIEIGTMLAAPFASHIMAQLGAEIIKVESPLGDPTRALVRGGPSGTLIAYSFGKKGVCIDLTKQGGKAAMQALIKTADVLIHNLAPKATQKLGLAYEECIKSNPELVYCHIRGYGQGPNSDDLASNPVAEAATGVMESNVIDGRPRRLGPSYHDQFAGAYAVIDIIGALLQKEKRKFNNHPIEIGLYETGLHIASRDLVGVQLKTQLLGHAEREPSGEFSMPGYGAYETSDNRWLYLLMLTDGHWLKFCQGLNLQAAKNETLKTLRNRKKNKDLVEQIVKDAISSFTFDEITKKLTAAGVGSTEVLPLERVLDSKQAKWPGKLKKITYRGLDFSVPNYPITSSNNTEELGNPPPEHGEHTIEQLLKAGLSTEECQTLIEEQAIKVSDNKEFTWAPVKN